MPYYDSHCHLSPNIQTDIFENDIKPLLKCQKWPINLMMTNHIDEPMIISVTNDLDIINNENIMLNVGIHPWFSHLYTFEERLINEDLEQFKKRHYENVLEKYSKNSKYDHPIDDILIYLPIPININEKIKEFKNLLMNSKFKSRLNIGEIGIDKLARVPRSGYLGNQKCVGIGGLSNYKVKVEHQAKIFDLHVQLAICCQNDNIPKKISIHCVNAHGYVFQSIKDLKVENNNDNNNVKINIVMHSYSGSEENAKNLMKLNNVTVWFGLSDVINLNKANNDNNLKDNLTKLLDCIHNRLLVETDLGIDMMKENHERNLNQIIENLKNYNINEEELLENWNKFCK
jgi:Tat protein secretion system quality control protein TatD with DNase activity